MRRPLPYLRLHISCHSRGRWPCTTVRGTIYDICRWLASSLVASEVHRLPACSFLLLRSFFVTSFTVLYRAFLYTTSLFFYTSISISMSIIFHCFLSSFCSHLCQQISFLPSTRCRTGSFLASPYFSASSGWSQLSALYNTRLIPFIQQFFAISPRFCL